MSPRPRCNYNAAVARVLWEGGAEGGGESLLLSETDRGSYNGKGEEIRCRREVLRNEHVGWRLLSFNASSHKSVARARPTCMYMQYV